VAVFSAESKKMMVEEEERRGEKRVRGEEKEALLQLLANFQILESGRPLSQDLVNVIIRVWACTKLMGVKDARGEVSAWLGIGA
jgi:hypothetical protein